MKVKPDAPPYLSVAAVAAFFGVSSSSIYKARGCFAALRFVSMNGRRLVLRDSVEQLDEQLQAQARSANDGLRLVTKKSA